MQGARKTLIATKARHSEASLDNQVSHNHSQPSILRERFYILADSTHSWHIPRCAMLFLALGCSFQFKQRFCCTFTFNALITDLSTCLKMQVSLTFYARCEFDGFLFKKHHESWLDNSFCCLLLVSPPGLVSQRLKWIFLRALWLVIKLQKTTTDAQDSSQSASTLHLQWQVWTSLSSIGP